MINIKDTFKKPFNTKVDSLGLSVFRILYSLVLLCETSQLYRFRHIIYDKDPFVNIGEIDVTFIFIFWFIVLVFLMLGLFTRVTTILNYIFGVIIFSSAHKFEYHVFYNYVGINFLLMFIPISRVFSLDCLFKKIKYSQPEIEYKPERKVLEINYLIIVFFAIAIVYFDSIFQKLSSQMWLKGLGMWLPSSLPIATWNNTSIMLNQEFLMKFLGYFVLVFEGLFIFLFWFKSLRVPLMIIGILFHIGIVVIYPIPWFALTIIAVYLLMLPQKFWLTLAGLFKSKKFNYTIFYNPQCIQSIKIVAFVKHIDLFSKINFLSLKQDSNIEKKNCLIIMDNYPVKIQGITKQGKQYTGYRACKILFKQLVYTYPIALLMSIPGIKPVCKKVYNSFLNTQKNKSFNEENLQATEYVTPISAIPSSLINSSSLLKITTGFWKLIVILMLLIQSMMVWTSPVIQKKIHAKSFYNKSIMFVFNNTKFFLKSYFGFTYHDVFVDDHFKNYNHILKIKYIANGKEYLVPIVDDFGMPTYHCTGFIWRDITFNLISPNLNEVKIESRLIPYLKFYISENKITGSNPNFIIYVKEMNIPQKWEKDFLNKQISIPWKVAGKCNISANNVIFEWSDYMKTLFIKELKTSQSLN